MKRILLLTVLCILPHSSVDANQGAQTTPVSSAPGFNFVFRYGVEMAHPNVIDTAQGKFTKDMIIDPSITIDLKLTDEEMATIRRKLDEIDFWNAQKFPVVFTVPNPDYPMFCGHFPKHPLFISVTRDGTVKELAWADDDTGCTLSQAANELRELESLIRNIVESKPEYKSLPMARGGYA